ncbi:MAG: 50S ribosomal protein L24 [Nitrospirae bacterium]|nr:50S ribosomal protein L24 [Nitrospirota bacterium]
MGLTVKREDTVLVISGDDKGKRGRVLEVFPGKGKLVIERINIIKKHMKPNNKYKQGGIIEKEAPVHISNVMLICSKCGEPVRIGNKALENGVRVRTCNKCGEVI